MGSGEPRWLLIGNSRWHWATTDPDSHGGCRYWHSPATDDLEGVALVGWASVGPIPPTASLAMEQRLTLKDVPLLGTPPWLGVDRALAAWLAWSQAGGPVLVADAGTVLSLTLVNGEGEFLGGRLLAGAGLQLRAMAAATLSLPEGVERILEEVTLGDGPRLREAWPAGTPEAMVEGVLHGLASAIGSATSEACSAIEVGMQEDARRLRLVLTGGDAPALEPLVARHLESRGTNHEVRPSICIDALMQLRPLARAEPFDFRRFPGRRGSDRPWLRPAP